MVPDGVAVDLAARREAGVEVGRRLGDVEERDVRRAGSSSRPRRRPWRRDARGEREAGDLPVGVHAGVGAARRRARTPPRRAARGWRPRGSPGRCACPAAAASPRSRCRRTRRRRAGCAAPRPRAEPSLPSRRSKLEQQAERPGRVADVQAVRAAPGPRCRRACTRTMSAVWLTPISASKSRAASGSRKSSTSASAHGARASPACRRAPAAHAVVGDLAVAVGDLPVGVVEAQLAVGDEREVARLEEVVEAVDGRQRDGHDPERRLVAAEARPCRRRAAPAPTPRSSRRPRRRRASRSRGRSASRPRSGSAGGGRRRSSRRRACGLDAVAVELRVDVGPVGPELQLEGEVLRRVEAVRPRLRRARREDVAARAARAPAARAARPSAVGATRTRAPHGRRRRRRAQDGRDSDGRRPPARRASAAARRRRDGAEAAVAAPASPSPGAVRDVRRRGSTS